MYTECERLLNYFGKDRLADDSEPQDFVAYRAELAKGRNRKTLDNLINRCRLIFSWAYKNHLVKTPPRFGSSFDRVSQEALRRERNNVNRMFEACQIRALLEQASVPMRAMILLGVGNGLGNTDIARLTHAHLDLAGGWLNYPRPKTAIPRRSRLWTETTDALRAATTYRSHESLVFVTKLGNPYERPGKAGSPITQEFRKLLTELGFYRQGLSFYSLRHVHETVGGECRDQPAVDYSMGHRDPSMAANYRHRISDDRLIAVSERVHAWLFGEEGE
jgi:integrase